MSKLHIILAQCADSPQEYPTDSSEYKLARYALKKGFLVRTEKGYETTKLGQGKLTGVISQNRDYDRLLVILANANGEGYVSDDSEASSISNAKNNGWISYREGYGFIITSEGKEKLRQILAVHGIKADLNYQPIKETS